MSLSPAASWPRAMCFWRAACGLSALLALIVLAGAAGLLAFAPQMPLHQLAQDPASLLDPNGRDRIWRGYLDEFLASPLFGRGLGAAERLPRSAAQRVSAPARRWRPGRGRRVRDRRAPLGLARARGVRPGERAFVWALFLALGAYAFTDNVLIMPAGMIPFVYLAVMRTSRRGARRRRARALAAQPAAAR